MFNDRGKTSFSPYGTDYPNMSLMLFWVLRRRTHHHLYTNSDSIKVLVTRCLAFEINNVVMPLIYWPKNKQKR